MAKFDGKFLTGVIGPAVFKKYRNMQLVTGKSRLTKEKQTENTHKAATQFGIASTLAEQFRSVTTEIITDFYDGTMVYRFRTDVQKALKQAFDAQSETYHFTTNSFDRLNGFEFNADSPVMDNFFVQPEQRIEGNILTIKLPEMLVSKDMKFPAKATSCLLNIAVGMYDLTYGNRTMCPIQSIEIPNGSKDNVIPAQELSFEIEPGCLCISMFSFQFIQKTFSGNLIINSKTFNPVAVFRAVIADGIVDQEQTEKWDEMSVVRDSKHFNKPKIELKAISADLQDESFTIAQIEQEQEKVKSGADFPKYVQAIKKLGVAEFVTYVSDSHTQYFGHNGHQLSSKAQYEPLVVAAVSHKKKFRKYLKMHQAGQTDYLSFCRHCAETGIDRWIVNLSLMTCTYYDQKDQLILTESIPNSE
ncbi:DUF1398 domain-containing protein [Pedobacter hiemivivus]|nr:DUF1398 family protein [Pedobacter hiemivivus]